MATLSFLVGVVGNIITVLLFLSPVKTFRRIVQNRSTEDFESLPYVCALLNSILWTCYSLRKSGEILVATVNIFGVVAEVVYITLFLVFASPRMRAKTALLVGFLNVGFPAAAILMIKLLLHGEMQIDVLGFICSGLCIVTYGSPLAAMKTVVTTRSVEYMPFFLSVFVLLSSGIWTLYALLKKDWFLIVPNGVGFVLGGVQLLLYAIFRKPKALLSDHDIEDGWQSQQHYLLSRDLNHQNNSSS